MDNSEDIALFCRLCLDRNGVNIPIFEDQDDTSQIFEKISSCLPVKVTKDDKLPKNICDGCSEKLDLLYEFRNTSVNAEKTLLTLVGQQKVTDDAISLSNEIAKTNETFVKEEFEDAKSDITLKHVAPEKDIEEPPPKRARRSAALRAQINIAPDSEDEDDDLDTAEAIAKIEDESDESDGEDKDPTYTDVPGTSADDQPGPSGLGKDGVEASAKIQKRIKKNNNLVQLKCCVCSRQFKSQKQLVFHFKNLNIRLMYKCKICQDFSYTANNSCSHGDENKVLHCEYCGLQLNEPKTLHICFHLKSVGIQPKSKRKKRNFTKRNKMETANDTSVSSDAIVEHENAAQGIADREAVAVETIESESTISFVDEDIVHEVDDDLEMCIYCNKLMLSSLLGKHEAWHRSHDKQIRDLSYTKSQRPSPSTESLCAICGLFKPSNKLRRHENADHMKQYVRKVCDVCGIFTCPTYIKEHMRTHDSVKQFKCNDCDKAFFRKKALARHRLVHSDVAQWVCSVCGKSFKIKFNLKVHMRSHEAIKPFPCSVCKKTFTTKQWRDNHMKTHGIVGYW